MLSAEERYNHDPMFHTLVDVIFACLERSEMTPTEVREAAVLACVKHEQMRPRPMPIILTEEELEKVRPVFLRKIMD